MESVSVSVSCHLGLFCNSTEMYNTEYKFITEALRDEINHNG